MKHECCGFAHIHTHSHYSLQDGFATLSELAQRAVKNEQKHLCITDHGIMGAVPNQISVCQKHKLEPIFGVELYMNPEQLPFETDEERKGHYASLTEEEKDRYKKSFHLLAVAFNETGYKNLVRLTSWGYLYGWGGRPPRPRVNWDMLMKHKEGILFSSCCYASQIGYTFDKFGPDAAEDMVCRYVAAFGPNFRLEIMMLDFSKQSEYDKFIIKMHLKYGIPIFLSQDVHYAEPEDSPMQQKMLMMQTGRTMAEVELLASQGADMFELQDRQLWLKSEDELNSFWEKKYSGVIDYEIYKEAKRESVRIAEKCSGVKLNRELKLPQLPGADELLAEYIRQGVAKRGIKKMPNLKEYLDRIKQEYELFTRKGFSSYFIIEKKFTDIARIKGPEILGYGDPEDMVGPGRGCLSPDSSVVMHDGRTKPISEVVVGDKVWTHNGTVEEVLRTFAYDCDETLLRIKSYYGDSQGVTLTKDHKVLVQKAGHPKDQHDESSDTGKRQRSVCEPSGSLEWMPAAELEVGDWVFVPPMAGEDKVVSEVDLTKFCDDQTVFSEGCRVVQIEMNSVDATMQRRNEHPGRIPFDQEFACILGVFSVSGWLRADSGFGGGFMFHEDQKDVMDFVERKLVEWGFHYDRRQDEGNRCVQFVVDSQVMYRLFASFFSDYRFASETKHVPEQILGAEGELIEAFLHGCYLAAGRAGKNKASISSVSRRLCDEVRFLCHRIGIPSSLGVGKTPIHREDFDGLKDSWVVRMPHDSRISGHESRFRCTYWPLAKGGHLTRIRSIEEVQGISKVYDIEVGTSHSFLTTSFVVHNSAVGALISYLLGITDVDPLRHDLLVSRFISEDRGRKLNFRMDGVEPISDQDS